MATNWRNVVARCKFLDASLYNVNDATHSMVITIRFGCLQTEVSINLKVNWLCLCDFLTFRNNNNNNNNNVYFLYCAV